MRNNSIQKEKKRADEAGGNVLKADSQKSLKGTEEKRDLGNV
jgi:hypothetical protein